MFTTKTPTTAGLLVALCLTCQVCLSAAGKDTEARQALDQGDLLEAKWDEASLRQAAEQFDKAALLWRSSGDFTNASRALLKSGDTYFNRSEFGEARKRFQEAASFAAKKGNALGEARALSRLARLSTYSGNNDVAQQQLNKARALLRQAGSTPDAVNADGEALTVEGELLQTRGNFKKALTDFDEALARLDGDRNSQARVHLFIGYIKGSIGNTEKAADEISQARTLYQATNNKVGEAQALSALGLVHSAEKDPDLAIQLQESARKIFRTVGDRHSEAIANNALGQAYELLKQPELALKYYSEGLRLFENVRAVNGTAPSSCNVARAHLANNNLDQALTFYQRCLNLSRSAGMTRIEVSALNEMAMVYAKQQRYELALSQQHKVQKFYESIGDQRGLARALNVYGDLLLQPGRRQQAMAAYQRALDLSKQTGEQDTQLTALYKLADTNLANGDPEAALPFIRDSMKLIEDQRANVASPGFRTSYFSGERQHYDLGIEILTQLERRHSGQGFGAEALLISEKSRARLLVDLVNESRASIHAGATKDLLDRERELVGLIRAQSEYRMDLASNPKNQAALAEADEQLQQLDVEYQQVEVQLRQQSPYLSSLEHFEPVTLDQIQKGLDPNTMLLEYALGAEQSYLFAVTPESFQIYELPKRQILEDTARKSYELLTAWQGTDGQSADDYRATIAAAEKAFPETAAALSQMLLGPVADKLGNKRLVLVLEGALQYVPFAALPSPDNSATPLLERHEIVVEPSVSALAAIRKNAKPHSTSPDKLVAVIADPVLNGNDDRVRGTTAIAATDKSQPVTRDASFVRLAHASEEADAIAAAAPAGTTMIAKGFDANRETAMSANVGQYQIVHFATHGVLNSEHPELSGIVLTMVDRNGEKTDGLMALHDIYSLDLSAELTVLSACQTALGKDIRGEGLVGLSHAFMSAGSKSVVSSLWKVDDRATAALMGEFYDAMLQQGMSPAAALRAAQLKMMRDERTKAPYYWAAFVIQGEYTNRINVERHSPFRVALVLLVLLSLVTSAVFVFRRRNRRISSTQSTGMDSNA